MFVLSQNGDTLVNIDNTTILYADRNNRIIGKTAATSTGSLAAYKTQEKARRALALLFQVIARNATYFQFPQDYEIPGGNVQHGEKMTSMKLGHGGS